MRYRSPAEKLLIQEITQAAEKLKIVMRGLRIGHLIKTIRLQLGMSQKALAKHAGVPQSTVSRIEQGLKAIHRDMFGDVWEWAGTYRKSVTTIGIKPGLIPMRLAEFCREVNPWFETPPQLTFVEMAARIHHQLVSIHPFENGNGRFSRLIADRFLLAWKCPYPIWPDLNVEGLTRRDYIHTLKFADKGEYASLMAFMKRLGASDPKLTELVRDNFYRALMRKGGASVVKALVESGKIYPRELRKAYAKQNYHCDRTSPLNTFPDGPHLGFRSRKDCGRGHS